MMSQLKLRLFFLLLQFPHMRVGSIYSQEFSMSASFDNTTFIHDKNLLSILNCG